jgi:5-methyltetrahydrofolate--homocysteine methyltransferase
LFKVNISAEAFIEAVEKHNPDILAMSALMTTTAPEQMKVIDALKEKGLREKVKVMVGGGGITAAFAESIGADGYEPTAPEGAKLARSLLGR